jgi:hypothetical protein
MRVVDKDFGEVTFFDFEFGTDIRGMRVPVFLVLNSLSWPQGSHVDGFGSVPPIIPALTLFRLLPAAAEILLVALCRPILKNFDLYIEYRNHERPHARHPAK